jgi:hypothetical protein
LTHPHPVKEKARRNFAEEALVKKRWRKRQTVETESLANTEDNFFYYLSFNFLYGSTLLYQKKKNFLYGRTALIKIAFGGKAYLRAIVAFDCGLSIIVIRESRKERNCLGWFLLCA